MARRRHTSTAARAPSPPPGGSIYVRGAVESHQVGAEVQLSGVDERVWTVLRKVIEEFRAHAALKGAVGGREEFVKLSPRTRRPYASLYSH